MYQSQKKVVSKKFIAIFASIFLAIGAGGMLVNTASAFVNNNHNESAHPKLMVIKHVVNDNGGTSTASNFILTISTSDEDEQTTLATFTGSEAGTLTTLASNEDNSSFVVKEPSHIGYTVSFSGDCDSKGKISIKNGQSKTCTVTNNDIIRPENTLARCSDKLDNDGDLKIDLDDSDCVAFMPKITVTKVVVGGSKVVSDFPLFVTDNDNDADDASSTSIQVTSGVAKTLDEDTYVVSEVNTDKNYIASFSGDCSNELHSVTLAVGDVRSCIITNTYIPPVIDICPNIDGPQSTIPEGMMLNSDHQCVEIPLSCDTQSVNTIVVSDTSNSVVGEDTTAYATFVHSAWTSISGSTWIWDAYHVAHPDQSETKDFSKDFTVMGTLTSATLEVAADNSFTVWINGTQVAADTTEFNYSAVKSYTIATNLLIQGTNTIKMEVTNFPSGTDPEANPAGALYKLTLTGNSCLPPPICTEGQVLKNNICITPHTGDNCTEGQHSNNDGGCVDDTPPVTPPTGGNGGGGGSTIFDYWGCTNKNATNFNSLASKDDGSCKIPQGGSSSSTDVVGSNVGEVLGASTTTPDLSLPIGCTEYIHSYMRQGRKNDSEDISRLQTFLNETMGAKQIGRAHV